MKGERSFFLFFLFSFFSVFFFSLSVRTSLENAFASTHGRQCILICSSYNSTDHGCKTRISCDRDHEGDEGVVRLARVVRGGFASGKRKRFSRVWKGEGGKGRAQFRQRFGPETANSSARANPATATCLRNNGHDGIGGGRGTVRCRIEGSSMRHAPLGRRVNAAFRVN